MPIATAQLNNYRQSPRKVRVVSDAIRGKKVSKAKNILTFLTKRAAGPLNKLLNSAAANAKQQGLDEKSLIVKSIMVNGGTVMHRRRPVARGASHPIRKRTSHVKVILEAKEVKKERSKN